MRIGPLLLAAGRRSKFLVLVVAILLAGGLAGQAGKLDGVIDDDPIASLPSGAESVLAAERNRGFSKDDVQSAIVVVAGKDRLSGAQRDAIGAFAAKAKDGRAGSIVLAVSPPRYDEGRTAAVLAVTLRDTGDEDRLTDAVTALRDDLAPLRADGLQTAVTGAAGFSADISDVFAGLDGKLLAVTGGLVLLLLIGIYRSPVFWLIPFFTVALAEGASRGAGALLGEAGLTVTGQSSGILSVLVFGAATDYALLLVSRYREELRVHDDAHDAMRVALTGAAPAILASGGTVVLGLLTLLLADVGSTRAIGPLGAAGVAIAVAMSLTALPATLVLAGRRAFWPFVPHVGDVVDPERSVFHRIGAGIARRPRRTWVAALGVLLVMAAGLTQLDTTLAEQDQFTDRVEAVDGQKLLTERFSAGLTAPATVIVPRAAQADAVRRALADRKDLASGVGATERGPAGSARVSVVLAADPYGDRATTSIPALRDVVRRAAPGTIVGGPTAEAYDLRDASQRDNLVVPPVALLLVLLVLIGLLRAVAAPLLLLASVIVSFAAALGVGTIAWDVLFDFPAAAPSVPLLAFTFLVALGVDYNIFLATRAREEADKHGTRAGMLVALTVTGGVITAAGAVLAGTFSVLAVLPLVALTELGFVVAFGVLLDTLLVRSVLVPALVSDLGPRTWWPSRARGDVEAGKA